MNRLFLVAAISMLWLDEQNCRADIAPANSFLSCHPFAARADGKQFCEVQVVIHRADGFPAANEDVTLISDRGTLDDIEPAIARTDELGRADFRVTSMTPGTSRLVASCSSQQISQEIVARGAVGIYTFDGNSPAARMRDLSGCGNHGSIHGEPTFIAGHRGEGIYFNGPDQYLEIPNSPSLGGLHGNGIECWVRTSSGSEQQPVAVLGQKSRTFGGDYRLSLHGRKIAYHYRSSQREQKQLEEALSDDDAISNDEWTHAVGFWEGSDIHETVRFHGYVRAYTSTSEFVSVPKAQQVEGIWNSRNTQESLYIGGNGTAGQSFLGLIDDFRIYDRALYDEELRRNHEGVATITFGLLPPVHLTVDLSLPECVILSWEEGDRNVTSYSIYRSVGSEVSPIPENLLKVIPYGRSHFRDYEVDYKEQYTYRVVANSFENQSLPSNPSSAKPVAAPHAPRWYRGDGHLHTYTHDVDVEDFDPENTLLEARNAGWDFALVTEHNSLGSYFRNEDQGTADFIVIGNGQEISDGGEHRTGAFLQHYIPTSDSSVIEQNQQVLDMGGEVGPNHNAYRNQPVNITLFEAVNNLKWYPLDAWDNEYLKRGIHVTAKGGSDAHGRFSIKRGSRWCIWADRLSYRALKEAIHAGRTFAVDGDGLLCMMKINGVMIGDTVELEPGNPVTIEMSANASLGNVSEVKLIRFGEVIQTWTPGEPNWKLRWSDENYNGSATYYRLEVQSDGKSRRAVTSAIFIVPARDAERQ